MIEVLENVLKYSDNFEDFIDQENDYFPEFELKRYETGYILVSRNPVRNEDREVISKKIDRINNASEEELKKMYRETITNGIFTEKGGAGLGFIEMAKVTDLDLEYNFSDAKKNFSVYELILHIKNTDNQNHG